MDSDGVAQQENPRSLRSTQGQMLLLSLRLHTYHPNEDGKLETASIPLNGPTGESLEVRGRFKAHLTRKGIKSQQEIYVVRNLSRALLGRLTIQVLKVAVLVEPVQGDNVAEQFTELFKGLGKLKESYKIKLREGATPFTLTTP